MKDADQYVDEESELSPVSLYAETKVAVETGVIAERSQRWLVSDAVAVLYDLRGISANALRSDCERIHHGDADQETPYGFWRAVLAALRARVAMPPGQFSWFLARRRKGRRACV